MNTHLVWFQNDLRLHDHGPLDAACREARGDGGGVLAIYVVDPFWFGETSFGFERMGSHRRRFLKESLADLQQRVRDCGSEFVILTGDSVAVLTELIETVEPNSLRFHHQFATQEKRITEQVEKAAARRDVRVESSPAGTLYDPADFPFEIQQTPELFTKFRRAVEKDCEFPPPIEPVTQIPSPSPEVLARARNLSSATRSVDDMDRLADKPIATGATAPQRCGVLDFRGGETAGRDRINDYFWKTDSLRRYKETRNGMLGADYSSKFSPWLAMGGLSPRRIAAEVRRYESERVANDSTYWLIFELLWRDYFALMVAKHGSHVFQVEGLRREKLPWNQDRERFECWRSGRTGFPLIDANMRELAATGFMSNRGRQNVGSFLTKNLGLDWRMGAEWFESQLIDYDPCSNYGNWNYVAGVGNDARGFRWFNTTKQANDYDPEGEYVRHWCPELQDVPRDKVHEPWKMDMAAQKKSRCVIGVDYPTPIVDLSASADHHQRLYQQAVSCY